MSIPKVHPSAVKLFSKRRVRRQVVAEPSAADGSETVQKPIDGSRADVTIESAAAGQSTPPPPTAPDPAPPIRRRG